MRKEFWLDNHAWSLPSITRYFTCHDDVTLGGVGADEAVLAQLTK